PTAFGALPGQNRAPILRPSGSMATTRDAEAVFHDRKAVEEAVRALELEGIRRNRIRVQRANTLGGVVRRPPERGGIMVAGAGMGAVVGVGIGLLAMLGTGVLPP